MITITTFVASAAAQTSDETEAETDSRRFGALAVGWTPLSLALGGSYTHDRSYRLSGFLPYEGRVICGCPRAIQKALSVGSWQGLTFGPELGNGDFVPKPVVLGVNARRSHDSQTK